MKSYKTVIGLLGALCALILATSIVYAQEKSAQSTVQVHLVITNEAVRGDSEVPTLQSGDVKVKQGKTPLQVTQLIPAQGDNAALQLFILIDDTLDSGVGNNLNDLRDFTTPSPHQQRSQWVICRMRRSTSFRISPPTMRSPLKRSACLSGDCRRWIVPICR